MQISERQTRLKQIQARRIAMERLRDDHVRQQEIGKALLAWAQAVWECDPRAALLLQNAKLSALHGINEGGTT